MQGQIKVMQLDLADLASVNKFSKAYKAEECGPDLLILNAGVMACPQTYTKDGFEMQIGRPPVTPLYNSSIQYTVCRGDSLMACDKSLLLQLSQICTCSLV